MNTSPLRQVFVIENDAAVRDSMRCLFGALGYAVTVFASAEEFLAVGDNVRTDCLVVDFHLSGRTGLELLEGERARGSNTPAILMTANMKLGQAQIERAAILAVLQKPVSVDALRAWVEKACALGTSIDAVPTKPVIVPPQ